jgi:hypothetical protein
MASRQSTIVGPFDFAVPKHYDNKAHRITFEEWEELTAKANNHHNIKAENINQIIPLQ